MLYYCCNKTLLRHGVNMDENDLISKKELLAVTKISYGQLYRWKRENLIPESWFIKKSSFTGQETFFPKDKILKRVNEILNLKDKFSLDELANMISPGLTKRMFDSREIRKLPQLKHEIIDSFEITLKRNYFNFLEILFIYILCELNDEFQFDETSRQNLIVSFYGWSKALKDTSYRFIVLLKNSEYFFLLTGQDSKLFYDNNTKEVKLIDLDESAKELSLILKDLLMG